ncbi:hypothetical protein TD95_003564 [Thielaviopsis punctulata]|uniref:Zn(2)-C6 fungal-type domain-containing protein n=1 Tax=Thielaviopsis punctulata TaxID=72032 RepID=A0A0F4ZB77_9PEZI|nr:hypothetical protein TD95_003564 [Thielaviopsis punctulata]
MNSDASMISVQSSPSPSYTITDTMFACKPQSPTSPKTLPTLAPAMSPGSDSSHGATADAAATGSPPASTAGSNSTASVSAKKPRANSMSSKDAAAHKITKRRAARACVSCRARKVRCDVVEGAPCGNCRWDGIECVVQESRRRKKNLSSVNGIPGPARRVSPAEVQPLSQSPTATASASAAFSNHQGRSLSDISSPANAAAAAMATASVAASVSALEATNADARRILSQSNQSMNAPSLGSPFTTGLSDQLNFTNNENMMAARRAWANLLRQAQNGGNANVFNPMSGQPLASLPAFIRPLPSKIGPDEIAFLHAKGSLTLPSLSIQSALLQAYAEYVHPFMPLLDLHGFLTAVNARNDPRGQISLFLYHCAMFAASAFVGMDYLRECGYSTRKSARKAFYIKARTLYDLDYEADRLILVQGLLLMTFWYESPDDQKDTWHWMGIATSLAHSIGLHRISSLMNVPARKLGLYRRIWWSCFMRDQEIALGMRRPTRIKAGDFNVDMLQESDFDIRPVSDDNTAIPRECRLLRDVRMQRDLAEMAIAKAKLCVLVSHMLKIQYSVHTKGTVPMDSASMLFPNKTIDNVDEVNEVDGSLNRWRAELPESCSNRPLTPFDVEDGKATIAVHRSLLHMIYYTTQSALHRPQFLGMQPAPPHMETKLQQSQEMARIRVRDAATQITRMATDLHELELDRYLPTTGVTIVLPAMIIHMLEMKHHNPQVRDRAVRGFKQCMDVMQTLRTCYAAAEYATGFLDAFLRKASIDIHTESMASMMAKSAPEPQIIPMQQPMTQSATTNMSSVHTPPPETAPSSLPSEMARSIFSQPMMPNLQPMSAIVPPRTNVSATTDSMPAPTLASEAPVLYMATTSPPHTEHDGDSALGSATPRGGSVAAIPEWDEQKMDGATTGSVAPEFEWSGVSTGEFDVDYWLQFPSEVGATDDAFAAANGKTASMSAPPAHEEPDALMWGSDPMGSAVDPMQMDLVNEADMKVLGDEVLTAAA